MRKKGGINEVKLHEMREEMNYNISGRQKKITKLAYEISLGWEKGRR